MLDSYDTEAERAVERDEDAEDQYYAEQWAEQELLKKIAPVAKRRACELFGRCDRCDRSGVLYETVCWTIGRAGVPGSEQTAFATCEPCLTGKRG